MSLELHSNLQNEEKTKNMYPPNYKVILLNDNYTPMEFVVLILEQLFYKNQVEAKTVMMHIHEKGQGICGIFTKEVAQTKIHQIELAAKQNQFPLRAIMEID